MDFGENFHSKLEETIQSLNQWDPGRFLGIISQNSSVPKSDQLHVVIFRSFFIDFEVGLFHRFLSEMISNFLDVLMNVERLFVKLNRFICN